MNFIDFYSSFASERRDTKRALTQIEIIDARKKPVSFYNDSTQYVLMYVDNLLCNRWDKEMKTWTIRNDISNSFCTQLSSIIILNEASLSNNSRWAFMEISRWKYFSFKALEASAFNIILVDVIFKEIRWAKTFKTKQKHWILLFPLNNTWML